MEIYGFCKYCRGRLAILDVLSEGYDLICTRCGDREMVVRRLTEPPPCFQ